jgi:7-cyano-7-deazaguanine reductase
MVFIIGGAKPLNSQQIRELFTALDRFSRQSQAILAAATTQVNPMSERKPSIQSAPQTTLDSFPNPHSGRDYLIHIQIPEFTCHCPLTGQPDFAHFTIEYIADLACIELKALKMFMWSFRDIGAFHEKVTNDVLDKIVATISPRFARVTARWNVRGGIYTNVVAEHQAEGWSPKPAVDLARFGLANPAAV